MANAKVKNEDLQRAFAEGLAAPVTVSSDSGWLVMVVPRPKRGKPDDPAPPRRAGGRRECANLTEVFSYIQQHLEAGEPINVSIQPLDDADLDQIEEELNDNIEVEVTSIERSGNDG